MKVAIIGNSHAVAVRQALLHDPARYAHTFDFCVQAGGNAPRLEQRGSRLFSVDGTTLTDFGKEELRDGFDPAPYDAVMFVSAGLPAHRQMRHNHLLNNFLHAGFAPQPYRNHQYVSGKVLALMIERRLLMLPAMESLNLTRSVFAGPLVVVTTPVPGPNLGSGEFACDLPSQYGSNLPTFMSWYYDQQVRVIAGEAERLGAMILTPPEAFLAAGATPGEFCSNDPWHMKHDYGHMILADAMRLLGASA